MSGGGSALTPRAAPPLAHGATLLHRIGIGASGNGGRGRRGAEEKLENDKKEKMEEGAQSHAWARARGETRLRVPSQWLRRQEGIKFGGAEMPRFDFGRGKPLVRPSKMKLRSHQWIS